MRLPHHIYLRLQEQKNQDSFRTLSTLSPGCIDFSSNDYLGFTQKKEISQLAYQILHDSGLTFHGATGSRLVTGNHSLYEQTESLLATIHQVEGCLVYPSGYMANLGLLSAVPQRGDTVLYDALSHASIRDGIRLSLAHAHAFEHNNLQDLEDKIKRSRGQVFVVTESVFSMDGDEADISSLVKLCRLYQAYLIVDEAHSLGVHQWGKVQQMHLHQEVFARIVTFGKAMGTHGAAVLGSKELIDYLINFSRPLIYTTGLPPIALAYIQAAYRYLEQHPKLSFQLKTPIAYYHQLMQNDATNTPIQRVIVPGNSAVRSLAKFLQDKGYFVKPILSPTVPKGTERIRICLHVNHTKHQIAGLIENIHQWQKIYS